MILNILYNIVIYPIEFVLEIVFYLFSNVFRSSYSVSILFLSLTVSFLSLPLYNIAEKWQAKEREIQKKMKPMIDNIKSVFKGDKQYLLIRACQRINGYKTIYSFRGTLGLLIQIPFFLAAYNFIYNLPGLGLGSFLFIKDFSKPDELIKIGSYSINLLPFVMTLFSLLAAFVYSKKLRFKESLPLFFISGLFLIVLYSSPSGLLFYWTINCLFSLIKNIVIEYKLYRILNKDKILKAYNIFATVATITFILLAFLCSIERKAYIKDYVPNGAYNYSAIVQYYSKIFTSSDIYGFIGNTKKLPSEVSKINYSGYNTILANFTLNDNEKNIEDIGKIEIYYKLYLKNYLKNIYTFLLLLTVMLNFSNIHRFIFKNKNLYDSFLLNRKKLILISCITVSILSGLFIPSALIASSGKEFTEPFNIILNNLSMSMGIFLFYPLFLYILFSEKIKDYITLFFVGILAVFLINTFIMVGNYGNINTDFVFDNTALLQSSFKKTFINIALIFIFLFTLIFIIKKMKSVFIVNIYFIAFLVLLLISFLNINKIRKENIELKELVSYSKNINNEKIFNMSKNGKNILVVILDRAIPSYWYDAIERYPEYKTKLDGFTLFPNTVSLSAHTSTIASLYGGYDYLPYEISTNGNYNLTNKHNESLLMVPLALEKYQYKSVNLEPVYANFSDYPDLSIFQSYTNTISAYHNSSIYDYSMHKYLGILSNDLYKTEYNGKRKKPLRFSIFRMMPINLRYDFYRNKDWFYSLDFRINSSMSTYAMFSSTTDFISLNEDGNYYNIMHSMITHEPAYFNSDYLPSAFNKSVKYDDKNIYLDENSVRHFYANVASMNCLVDIADYLKKNNIYSNTKIIVVSDHAEIVNTSFFKEEEIKFAVWYNALLIYKDFDSVGEVKIDSNFMTIADVPYLSTKHIPNIKNPFNNKIITNDYKNNGAYLVKLNSWSISRQHSNSYNFDYLFHVKNNIFDINNWTKYEINWKENKITETDKPLDFRPRF